MIRKYAHYLIPLLLLFSPHLQASAGDDVIREAKKYIGVRELTGNNDGEIIEKIIGATGLDTHSRIPWCAAFNRYVYDRAGYPRVGPQGAGSAWSPAWVAKPTWKAGKGNTPAAGSTFGLYFRNLGRVGHTGLVEKFGPKETFTIEGNTGPTGSLGEADRNGDGVYRKRRLTTQIWGIQQWLP